MIILPFFFFPQSENQTDAENAENQIPNISDARNPANPEEIAPGMHKNLHFITNH